MTTRKDWMKRINSIAHMRARAAYRDEKAKLMQDVRQAVADGQDVNAFLAYLEREDLRASLPANLKSALAERTAAKVASARAAQAPAGPSTKSAAPRKGRAAPR